MPHVRIDRYEQNYPVRSCTHNYGYIHSERSLAVRFAAPLTAGDAFSSALAVSTSRSSQSSPAQTRISRETCPRRSVLLPASTFAMRKRLLPLFLEEGRNNFENLRAFYLRRRRYITFLIRLVVGRDSSVGIATRYGLDGPEIESRWRQDFPHPSRPALGPIQPPIQWIPGLFRG
jgi:hypothetical protein